MNRREQEAPLRGLTSPEISRQEENHFHAQLRDLQETQQVYVFFQSKVAHIEYFWTDATVTCKTRHCVKQNFIGNQGTG